MFRLNSSNQSIRESFPWGWTSLHVHALFKGLVSKGHTELLKTKGPLIISIQINKYIYIKKDIIKLSVIIRGYFCQTYGTYAWFQKQQSPFPWSVHRLFHCMFLFLILLPDPLKFPYHCNEIWRFMRYNQVKTLWLFMAQGQASHYWTAIHGKTSFVTEMDDGNEHRKKKAEVLI